MSEFLFLKQELESLKQELESFKMSINMLMTLSQSHQMMINNLMNKPKSSRSRSNSPKEELKKIEEPKKSNKVVVIDYNELAINWVKENMNDNGLNITKFIAECKNAIFKLSLQNTDDNLEDVITNAVKDVYNNLLLKNKPFFCFGPHLARNVIYKNKLNEWKFGMDEIVKLVSWLEKDLRENQLGQIDNDVDYMSSEEQELYATYMKWTTSDVDKSKIYKNLLEFITVLKF